MEPITTLATIKEIYETAKTIQKVYNVSREMKTVAESEGADQIIATKDVATSAAEISRSPKIKVSDPIQSDLGTGDIPTNSLRSDINSMPCSFVDKLDTEIDPKSLQYSDVQSNLTERPNLLSSFVDPLENDKSSLITTSGNELSGDILSNRRADNNVFVDKYPRSYDQQIRLSEGGNEVSTQNEINNSTNVDHLKQTDTSEVKEVGGITEEEKLEIKEKTGWSDKIVDAIRTKEEAKIYIDAGLVEGEINGKPALLQPKIDWEAHNEPKWPDYSNKDLAEEGYPPRDVDGKYYELHHIGQRPDSPLAELTHDQHHSDGNFKVLHTFEESSIDRLQFNKERREYWSERSKTL